MKYKSKIFRENNFFTLYDLEDRFICYFDNFTELSKIFNYDCRNLVKQFNKSDSNCIKIVIHKKFYHLYTFTDEDLSCITI